MAQFADYDQEKALLLLETVAEFVLETNYPSEMNYPSETDNLSMFTEFGTKTNYRAKFV